MVQAFFHFPDIPAEVAFDALKNIRERQKWDKNPTRLDIIEENENDDSEVVIYAVFESPVPFTWDRDFVNVRKYKIDYP